MVKFIFIFHNNISDEIERPDILKEDLELSTSIEENDMDMEPVLTQAGLEPKYNNSKDKGNLTKNWIYFYISFISFTLESDFSLESMNLLDPNVSQESLNLQLPSKDKGN